MIGANDGLRTSSARPPGANTFGERAIAIVFANLKGNLGDFAILHAMLKELANAYPGCGMHVYSHPLHDIDQERFEAFRQLAPQFELCGKTHGEAPGPFAQAALKFRLVPGGLASIIDRKADRWAEAFRDFGSYKAIFFAGGEQWSGRALGAVMFASLNAMHRQGAPIFAYPYSVRPVIERLYSPAAIKRLFAMLSEPIVVRDASSAAILARSGVTAVAGADCVLSLGQEARSVAPAPNRDASRLLLVATGSEDDLDAAVGALKLAGEPVEAMTTCAVEDGAKLEALARRHGIACRAPLTWQAAVAELKACRLVVANRLHGAILSTLADAPLLPIANRNKVRAFVEDAGIGCYAATFHDLSGLLVAEAMNVRGATLEIMRNYRLRTYRSPCSPLSTDALNVA